MPIPPQNLTTLPEAIVFDVFGTVFDWRSTVREHLEKVLAEKLENEQNGTVTSSGTKLNPLDLSTPDKLKTFCGTFAQEWRSSYSNFVATRATINTKIGEATSAICGGDDDNNNNNNNNGNPDLTPTTSGYTTVDEHHYDSLLQLLRKYGLAHFFSPPELFDISRIWHRLKPWADTQKGINSLREVTIVSTLSNGNVRLLADLQRNSNVRFDAVLSSQLWKGYKPEKKVYIGACEVLGVGDDEGWRRYLETGGSEVGKEEWKERERGKVAMAAAHISDLKAAKSCGLKTIYIKRPYEDGSQHTFDKYLKNNEDWIDMWVNHDDGGIATIAERLKELELRK